MRRRTVSAGLGPPVTDLTPPSLDDLPTQPPPPVAPESRSRRSGPPASRAVRTSLGPLMFVLMVMHIALTSTTYAVAVWKPSVGVGLLVVTAGNVVWGWCFVTMLGMLGRPR